MRSKEVEAIKDWKLKITSPAAHSMDVFCSKMKGIDCNAQQFRTSMQRQELKSFIYHHQMTVEGDPDNGEHEMFHR